MTRLALCLALAAAATATLAAEDELDSAGAIERARSALASQLGRPREDVVAEGATFVRFPDGALGCPRANESAPAVVTPGWRVALRLAEDRYDVRVAAVGTTVRVCGRLAAKAAPSPAVLHDLEAARLAAEAARRHLCARLAVPTNAVRRLWAKPVRWPEGRSGCDLPGRAETGSGVGQFLVLLQHGATEFLYRVDGTEAAPCATPGAGGG